MANQYSSLLIATHRRALCILLVTLATTACPSQQPGAENDLTTAPNNAGAEGSVVVNQVKGLDANMGFDAQGEAFTDMFESGIIDPTKVVRSALQNAASIAGLMLTTEALISDVPERKKDLAPMAGGMGEDF